MASKIYFAGDPSVPRQVINVCEKEMTFSTLARLFKRAWHKKHFYLNTFKMQIQFSDQANFQEYKTLFLQVTSRH